MFLVKSSSVIYTIRSRSLAKCYSCTVSYNIPSNPMRQIVLLSFLQMRKLRPRCGILTEVTEPGLPDVRIRAFNHCAIRVVLTVLGLVKLKVFLRDGRGMWPLGGVSESEATESRLRNESSPTQSKRQNGSEGDNHCQSFWEFVGWEWGHKCFQSHLEVTCGYSHSPFTHLPLPDLCCGSLHGYLWLLETSRYPVLLSSQGRDSAVPVEMSKPLLLIESESLNREPSSSIIWNELWAMASFLVSWAVPWKKELEARESLSAPAEIRRADRIAFPQTAFLPYWKESPLPRIAPRQPPAEHP